MERLRISAEGISAEVWTLGAALNALEVTGPAGPVSVLLGHPSEADRRASKACLGETVGPYANRIAEARFTLDGRTHQLERSFRGRHALHSGSAGFHRQEWEVLERGDDRVRLGLTWRDTTGEHPGPVHAEITYTVSPRVLEYEIAVTSEVATVVNVVGHPYANLAGSGDVLGHTLQIPASAYVPVDDDAIPTPEAPAPVAGTTYDLRQPRALRDLTADGPGLDHCFLPDGDGFRDVAVLADPASGRRLTIATDLPGLQVYMGQELDDSVVTMQGPAVPYAGVALETQQLPDAPNRPDFPSTVLRPGEVRRSRTRWTITS